MMSGPETGARQAEVKRAATRSSLPCPDHCAAVPLSPASAPCPVARSHAWIPVLLISQQGSESTRLAALQANRKTEGVERQMNRLRRWFLPFSDLTCETDGTSFGDFCHHTDPG